MRASFPLMLAVAILMFGCGSKEVAHDPAVPFSIDSLMQLDGASLRARFGGGNVRDTMMIDEAGMESAVYTILFPKTNREVLIQWTDSTQAQMAAVTVQSTNGSGAWRTRDSVYAGMPLADLARINGQPLSFLNATTDEGGYVNDWHGGKLNNRFNTVLIQSTNITDTEDFLASNDPRVEKAGLKVMSITIDRSGLPTTVTVEKVIFNAGKQSSAIPHLVDRGAHPAPGVERINNAILERFMIESFDPRSVRDFPWSDVAFDWEIQSDMLSIHFTGTYLGAYSTEYDERMFFYLSSGESFQPASIAFHSLFSATGYFEFMKQHWLSGCQQKYDEAVKCADAQPTCDCSDVSFDIQGKTISINLDNNECFPHAAMACAPTQTLKLPVENLRPYLNKPAANALFKSDYFTRTALARERDSYAIINSLPDYLFITGSIDNENPFSMAIIFAPDGNEKASGFYYRNTDNNPVAMEGTHSFSSIELHEKGAPTSDKWVFNWQDDAAENGESVAEKILTGSFIASGSDETKPVIFKRVRFNKTTSFMEEQEGE